MKQATSHPTPSKYLEAIDEWIKFENEALGQKMNFKEYQVAIHRYRAVLVNLQRRHIPNWIPGQFTSIYSSLVPILESDKELLCLKYQKSQNCECGNLVSQQVEVTTFIINENFVTQFDSLQSAINSDLDDRATIYCKV